MDETPEHDSATPTAENPEMQAEIRRLNKMVQVLMDRAERSISIENSDFSLFQTTVTLEDEVRRRTEQVTAALQENEKITRALRESEAKFRGLADQSLVGIGIIDDDRFTYVNAQISEVFGYSTEQMMRLSLLALVLAEDRPRVDQHMRGMLAGTEKSAHLEFRGVRKDGSIMQAEASDSLMEAGERSALIFLIADVTARKQAEDEVKALQARLSDQVIHDPLTALFNRRYLDETFDRELARAERHHYPISVVMGDIDHFKNINDEHGHLAGDEVLRVLGGVVTRFCRRSDIGCRYGGEEFLIVFPDMGRDDALARTEALRSKVEATEIPFGTSTLAVTMSFGIADFPQNGTTGDELIAAADLALYASKGAGRNQVRLAEEK